MDVRAVEPVDRLQIVESIKNRFCIGCDDYNGVRCRACNFDDALDVIDSVPALDLKAIRELVPQWISVKDDLPAHVCTPCLIYADGCTSIADWSHDKYGDDWWFYVDGEYDPEVTHWMPLPEPPKEDAHA